MALTHSSKTNHQRAGFTLVELLVCVAIVAILGTILMAAVGNVRTKAKISASASNLRQLGHAANLYRADNHDRLMPLGIYDPEAGVMREWCYSWDYMNVSFANGIVGQYVENAAEILRCPVWEPSLERQREYSLIPTHMGYGLNAPNTGDRVPAEESVSGDNGEWKGYSYSLAISPSETIMFTTAASPLNGREAVAPNQGMIWPPDHSPTKCVRLVNGSEAIVCMLDGSVTMMNATTELVTDDGVRFGYLDHDEDGIGDVDNWYLSPELHILNK